MANFRQYPDTNRISKALRRLVDPKRKNWATGSIESGFYITEAGKEIAIQVDGLLKNPARQKRRMVFKKRSRGRSPNDDVKEIKDSLIFQRWLRKNYQITDYEVLSLLGAVPYTPKELLLEHLEHLKQSANTVNDKKVLNFLKWLGKKFNHIFY